MVTKDYIKQLHQTHGAVIPTKVFTSEVYKQLVEFKEAHENDWISDEYIFAVANIGRYSGAY